MKKWLKWVLLIALVAAFGWFFCRPRPRAEGPSITWSRTLMDGSRTGVTAVTGTDPEAALGHFEDEVFITPDGTSFPDGPVPAVSEALLEVQPKMSRLKEVIGYCPEEMVAKSPESALSDMIADALREEGTRLFGVPMDLALINFGGIRCPMPQGDVILDDILSMFPFRNYVVYAKVRGRELRKLFDQFALTKVQCLSGVRLVIRDKQVVSAEIGGKPLDDDRLYNLTTVDFLLDGGDRIAIGAMAEDVRLSDVLIKDFMLRYISALTAAGKPVAYETDGRITVEE